MGNSKRVPAREEASDVYAEHDASARPVHNGNQALIETMEEKKARVTAEYIRIKSDLDSENLKLQQLTQQRTTQQALSNPNAASIDRMFSVDTKGFYVYKGSRKCCLDASLQPYTTGTVPCDTQCKHEVCARAIYGGLSWRELDTLKWYDMRIRHEKTDRMKGALMKQRDVELVRVKQSEEEERAKSARRFSKKETGRSTERYAPTTEDGVAGELGPEDLNTVKFESRMSMMQIQKYNIFVGVRQRAMADIAKCSDIVSMARLQKASPDSNNGVLEEQLRKAQSRAEALKNDVEWYGKKIAEAAQASKAVAIWQRADLEFDLDFDGTDPHTRQLCDLVKGLLTELGMPAETIDNIEHAQSALAHVMIQPASTKSLKLQKSLDHIKEVLLKFRTRSNEVRASSPNAALYQPMPASSGDLRNRIIHASVKEGRSTVLGNEIYSELIEIEDEAIFEIHAKCQALLASPAELELFLEEIKVKATGRSPVPRITKIMLEIMNSTWSDMSKAHALFGRLDELSDQVLVANISGLVFARAEKKVEWLMGAFTIVEAMMETVCVRPLPTRVTYALQRVQASVQARVRASMEPVMAPKRASETTSTSGGVTANVSQGVSSMVTVTSPKMGLSTPFTVHEQSIVDTVEHYTAETASRYASYLTQRKYCPGCATLRIAQLFTALLTKSPQQMDRLVAALSAGHPTAIGNHAAFDVSIEILRPENTPEMRAHTVACGVKYITDIFHALKPDTNVNPASERKVPIFGEMIALVVERVVLGSNAEQVLRLGKSSISTLKAASIIEKFSEDSRFACAAYHNGYCSQYTSDADDNRSPQTSVSDAVNQPILSTSRSEGGQDVSAEIPPPSSLREKLNTLNTTVMPGPARRRLLPRGERHLSQNDALEAAAKIASMGTNLARKMSDFHVLQHKAYERAGLALSPEAQYYMKQVIRVAYPQPGTRGKDHHDCQCPPCIARRAKSTRKTSKFVEDFDEEFKKEFDVTIDGRAVTDDELLGYSGATVERIRSLSVGEATLEYVCWVAHSVGEAANAAEAAGEEWTKLVERFEEFFTYYAEIPLELDLALDYVKGNIWPSPECRDLFPPDQWALIDDILAIMERIAAKQLTFANGTDDWLYTEPMVPEPLNLRKDRAATIGSLTEPTGEAATWGAKPFLFAEEPEQPQKSAFELEIERLRLKKNSRRTEAIQAQIGSIRQIDETAATFSPPADEISVQESFNAYNASARPVLEYMGTLAENDFDPEEDLQLAIAIKVQKHHLECVRMIQLIAESNGWDTTATQMKEHLDHWGFREVDGHYPDYWAGADLMNEGEDEGTAGDEEGTQTHPLSASDQNAEGVDQRI